VARIALTAETRGDCVGAVVYSDRVSRFVPPLSGSRQAERLLRYLGDVQPESVESDLRRALPQLLGVSRRTLVLVITDLADGAGATSLAAAVAELSERHVPLVMLVRDPQLDQALAARVERSTDAYRRAAAEMVSHERARAVELLQARGVRALDLSMQSLALRVVRSYVEARG
jgi:uncharacterized protein (DUF58 family)